MQKRKDVKKFKFAKKTFFVTLCLTGDRGIQTVLLKIQTSR